MHSPDSSGGVTCGLGPSRGSPCTVLIRRKAPCETWGPSCPDDRNNPTARIANAMAVDASHGHSGDCVLAHGGARAKPCRTAEEGTHAERNARRKEHTQKEAHAERSTRRKERSGSAQEKERVRREEKTCARGMYMREECTGVPSCVTSARTSARDEYARGVYRSRHVEVSR